MAKRLTRDELARMRCKITLLEYGGYEDTIRDLLDEIEELQGDVQLAYIGGPELVRDSGGG